LGLDSSVGESLAPGEMREFILKEFGVNPGLIGPVLRQECPTL